jgi:type III secretion protein W
MTDPIPVNFASIEQRAAQKIARLEIAQQVDTEDRLIEDLERISPAVQIRNANRVGTFRNLESRRKAATEGDRKIQEVAKKTEDDLANHYNRRNPELPADRLRQLRESLHQSQSAEEILQEVNHAFEDPTIADEAFEYLEQTTEGELKEKVARARALLYEQKGREIVAGRNVDTVAKAFHQKGLGESPSELRELYRAVTGNPRDHNTLFSELSEQYSFDQLKLVVAFLLKGMAFDLKSKGPSIQQAELMRLMTETRNLQSILWVYLFFKGRMRTIHSLYDQIGATPPHALSFDALAKEFIRLVEERYPSALKLLKEAEKLGVLDDTEKIIILMQYRDAIRGLSPRLYKSLRHRQDLLHVILEALDELEEEEEEG